MGGDEKWKKALVGRIYVYTERLKGSPGGCSPGGHAIHEASPSSSWYCPAEHTMKRKKKGDNGQVRREERGEV